MSNQIGRFEILSEITQSALGSVYKASDPDTGQTVVLKTLRLQPFGEQSAGLVQRVLAFGICTMGTFAFQVTGNAPEICYYTSPEQVRGEPLDSRSNLFSLGAIIYEMVTEMKPFAGNSTDELCRQITEATPPAPDQVNRKISLPLSKLIMRALAKVPDQRYQSGQELIYDLENCNETHTGTHAKTAAKKSSQPGVSSSTR